MAVRPREQIKEKRRNIAGDSEPIVTTTRSVGVSGDSLDHTIPEIACDLQDITTKRDVVIEVYEDGYWVEPVVEDSNDG
jgi:hypothetical protein